MKINKKLYLAYGSNLSIDQMRFRCPGARIVGTAEIKNYRLLYKGSKSGSYATIEPAKGHKVPVLVWTITPEDEASLDRYEGFPTFYYKKDFMVEITKLRIRPGEQEVNYGKHKAMAYIMDEKRPFGFPSMSYENVIKEGYKFFGFDEEILKDAKVYTTQQYNSQMADWIHGRARR